MAGPRREPQINWPKRQRRCLPLGTISQERHMELEDLVRRAAQRDVDAFVELTRRFQQFAFGSALAMVGDFHRAEDVVQEAFVAAWAALPTLEEPKAFPGWLRTIVRRRASRLLRRGHLET